MTGPTVEVFPVPKGSLIVIRSHHATHEFVNRFRRQVTERCGHAQFAVLVLPPDDTAAATVIGPDEILDGLRAALEPSPPEIPPPPPFDPDPNLIGDMERPERIDPTRPRRRG